MPQYRDIFARAEGLMCQTGFWYLGMYENEWEDIILEAPLIGADIFEPTWDGYERKALNWAGDLVYEQQYTTRESNTCVWTPGVGASGVIWGFILLESTSADTVYRRWGLETPITVTPGVPIYRQMRFGFRDPEATIPPFTG